MICLVGGCARYLSASSLCRRSCSSLSRCSRASLLFSARRREAASASIVLADGLHTTSGGCGGELGGVWRGPEEKWWSLQHFKYHFKKWTLCCKHFFGLPPSPAVLVTASVVLSGMFKHGISGVFSLLIFSCWPSADVLTGLELPGEMEELQREASSSGTDGSSSCRGVECLLTDLRGVL